MAARDAAAEPRRSRSPRPQRSRPTPDSVSVRGRCARVGFGTGGRPRGRWEGSRARARSPEPGARNPEPSALSLQPSALFSGWKPAGACNLIVHPCGSVVGRGSPETCRPGHRPLATAQELCVRPPGTRPGHCQSSFSEKKLRMARTEFAQVHLMGGKRKTPGMRKFAFAVTNFSFPSSPPPSVPRPVSQAPLLAALSQLLRLFKKGNKG